jgi:hypothetical protein
MKVKNGDRKGLIFKRPDLSSLLCKILTIDYEFAYRRKRSTLLNCDSGIVMIIQMCAITTSSSSGSYNKPFYLAYRPGHTCPEFLVHIRELTKCLLQSWNETNFVKEGCLRKASLLYDDGARYIGSCLSVSRKTIKPQPIEFELPIYCGVTISWDESQEIQQVSEWELEPLFPVDLHLDNGNISEFNLRNKKISPNDPISIDDNVKQELKIGIQSCTKAENISFSKRLKSINERILTLLEIIFNDPLNEAFIDAISGINCFSVYHLFNDEVYV